MISRKQIFAAALLGVAAVSGIAINSVGAFSGSQKQAVAALGGYDLVSFFSEENQPVVGSAQFTATHQGKLYHFATQANADVFKADPIAYLPQYGGHCAWAAAQGSIAPGDPKFATVVNKKLYLNYNADVQAGWSKDILGFIAKADRNWPSIAPKAN